MHYDEKIAVLGFEPMTYGSESECATHYTTVPNLSLVFIRAINDIAEVVDLKNFTEIYLKMANPIFLQFLYAFNPQNQGKVLSLGLILVSIKYQLFPLK